MPDPVTQVISVHYNPGGSPTWAFTDELDNDIPNGDLSAFPGANSFTFYPAEGHFFSFQDASISIRATSGGGEVTMASNSLLTLTIQPVNIEGANHFVIQDEDRETRDEILEYSFTILYDGQRVTCDPKIYNRS